MLRPSSTDAATPRSWYGGGLAIVGSRNVDDTLVEYTEEIGRLTAVARRIVISGGARGIDQAAMRGALEAGGNVVGPFWPTVSKRRRCAGSTAKR